VNPQPVVLSFSTFEYPNSIAPNPGTQITAGSGIDVDRLPIPDINLNIYSSACLVSAVLKVAPIETAILSSGRMMIGRGATLMHTVAGSFCNDPTYTGVFADQSNEIRTASIPNWDPKTMMRCTYTPRVEGAFTPTGTFGSDLFINGTGVIVNYPDQVVGYPGMMCIAEGAPSLNSPTGGEAFAYEAYCTYELHACGTSFASENVRATPQARPEARPMPPMIMRASDVPRSAGNLAISQIAEDKPPGFVDAVKKGLVDIPGQIKFGIDTANKVVEGVETAWDVIEDIGLAIGGIFGLAHAGPPRILHPLLPQVGAPNLRRKAKALVPEIEECNSSSSSDEEEDLVPERVILEQLIEAAKDPTKAEALEMMAKALFARSKIVEGIEAAADLREMERRRHDKFSVAEIEALGRIRREQRDERLDRASECVPQTKGKSEEVVLHEVSVSGTTLKHPGVVGECTICTPVHYVGSAIHFGPQKTCAQCTAALPATPGGV
jgi:hypothetical protein